MKYLTSAFLFVLMLWVTACSQAQKSSLSPSIRALKTDQTLIMNYNACHWECTKGTVIFKENVALLNGNSLILTEPEIADLDEYFKTGKSLEEGWGCSLPIEISFELKKRLKTVNSKDLQIYPCLYRGNLPITSVNSDVFLVTPGELVHHLNKRPNELPSWRLRSEGLDKQLVIEP